MKLFFADFRANMRFCVLLAAVLIVSTSLNGATDPPERWTESRTEISFVRIPAGIFQMGSPINEAERNKDEVLHTVHISHFFYMSEHEVTQSQWREVMGSNPSWFRECGGDCPVERINWYQVNEFIKRLSRYSHTLAGREAILRFQREKT